MSEPVWNVESLRQLMDERDRRYEERFKAQQEAIKKAHETEDLWRANANEWRAAMDDRERNFLSKGMGYIIGALSAVALVMTIIGQIK